MSSSTRVPSHLQPYVHLPRDESILLLTSTLGASANWLIIRFLCDALSNNAQDSGVEQGPNVVLISWMREYEFWKQEARKGGGLDLEKLRRDGRFAFVDGLSEICLDSSAGSPVGVHTENGTLQKTPHASLPDGMNGSPIQRGPQVLPVRGPPGRIIPARGPPQAAAQPQAPASSDANTTARIASTTQILQGHYTLKSLDLEHLKTTIISAVSSLASPTSSTTPSTQRKTFIILDNADLIPTLESSIKPSALTSLIVTLHKLPSVSHVLIHIQSDNPLLSLSTPPQPLEISHHNLVVKLGHMSRRILGVRVLDTGVARDVSGVIRITEQRIGWMELGLEDETRIDADGGRGKEFLYQVKGDGSVRVFDRGAGGEG
jgi:elongator complex protein 6